MFKMSNDYRTYKERGVAPIIYCFVTSTRNTRVYGTIPPDDTEIGVTQLGSCDGSIVAGDGTYLGALPIVEYAPRVLNFGSFRETLIPIQRDFLTSLTMTEIGSFLITLDNSDMHFSELLPSPCMQTIFSIVSFSVSLIVSFRVSLLVSFVSVA